MSLDIKITEAIEAAVEKEGQPAAVAKRLIAWLEAVTSGNEDITDTAQSDRHLDVLFEGTLAGGEE